MIQPSDIRNVRTEVMFVTPQQAEQWLQHNTNNRDVKQSVVNRLASDMLNGRWRFTHQGIAFNCDGTLLDGQHRLWAIFTSGKAQWMYVTFGLPKDSVLGIDEHVKRTASDCLQIVQGKKDYNVKKAMATALYLMGKCGVITNSYKSRQLQIETLNKHEEAIGWALGQLDSTARGLCRASLSGVIARAYYSQDRDRLAYFCRVLLDVSASVNLSADQPIFKLRDFMLQGAACGGSGLSESYRKCEYALVAWFNGRQLQQLREATEELFLLPGEKLVD